MEVGKRLPTSLLKYNRFQKLRIKLIFLRGGVSEIVKLQKSTLYSFIA